MKESHYLKTAFLIILMQVVLYSFILLELDLKFSYADQISSPYKSSEKYRFPTRNVSGFRELLNNDSIPNAEGIGYLYLPKEASNSNKVPLMIILHGSGGTWGAEGRDMLSS